MNTDNFQWLQELDVIIVYNINLLKNTNFNFLFTAAIFV